jgi:hypothetical protein
MLVNLTGRFAPAYRIKIGGYHPKIEKTSQGGRKYRPPVKYDHFKICHNERDPATGNFIPAVDIMKHYAIAEETPAEAKPTSLNIVFFSNDLGDIFDDWRALYESRKCQCRTVERFLDAIGEPISLEQIQKLRLSGIAQLARWDKSIKNVPAFLEVVEESGDFAMVKCPERDCKFTEAKKCKVNSVLRFMLVEAPELGAVAEFRTTSIHSAMQLKKSLELVYKLTGGHFAWLELQLRLEPKTVEQGTVFVAHVVYPHGGLLDLKKAAADFKEREVEYDKRLLIAEASVVHFEESDDEIAHVEAEYYSDDEGDIIDVKATDGVEIETGPEVKTPEESRVDDAKTADNGDPITDDVTPAEDAEKKDPQRHLKCPFPRSARVDLSYCDTECEYSPRCDYHKDEVPWESAATPDKDEYPGQCHECQRTAKISEFVAYGDFLYCPRCAPAPEKTFDLFK